MTIVASNSLTVSNVNDGTITHTAYANSADGTDGFYVGGGRNLLNNTDKDISITSHTTDDYPAWANIDTGFSFDHGKTYTFSAEAKNSTDNIAEASIRVFEYSTNTQVGIYPFPADGKRYRITFTIPNDSHDYHLLLYAGHAGINPGVDVTTTYHHHKLEEGDISAPAWSPAPSESHPSYIGQYSDFSSTASTDPTKYAPWILFKGNDGKDGANGKDGIDGLQGKDGQQGIPGKNGADGKTQYTHIAYANSVDGVTNFSTSDSNRTYIGMYVDFNINDSNTPSDYSWTLVKGADGTQGTPGKPGADGKTPYFHTAWSYSADGTDRFTTVYPNLNLFTGTSDKPSTKTGGNWNIAVIGVYKTPKVGQEYTVSVEVPNADHTVNIEIFRWNNAGGRVGVLTSKQINPGEKAHVTFTWPDPTDSGATQIAADFAWTNDTDAGSYSYCKAKLEFGSTATPYMPSATEVTTADWPSYIGQYTDFTQADSTTASDYTWSLIRGNDGKDGADGKDGIAGKDGVGINTTDITYAISISGTIAPTTGWTSSVPSLVKGQYLWTKTVWTYTDNSSETGYSVTYISKDGNNGNDGIAGKDGVGITATTITYVQSTSGTTAPSSGWTSNVPTVPAGQFLWTKTVWSYSDSTSETGYSVAMMGAKGDMGKSVWSYPYDRGANRLGSWWSDLKPAPTTDNPPKVGDTIIDLVGNIYQITNVVVGTTQEGGGLFDYGPMLTSIKGADGDPGKIVSDTEPTTRFKGLTWKYSGTSDLTASDGTVILSGTEYYWSGTNWILNEINAHNINGDNLNVTNGTFTDGKIKSIWKSGVLSGSTEIETSHINMSATDSTSNATNSLDLDIKQGFSMHWTDPTSNQSRSVLLNYGGLVFGKEAFGAGLNFDGTNLSSSMPIQAPNTIVKSTQFTVSGIGIRLDRLMSFVAVTFYGKASSTINNSPTINNLIPVGFRPINPFSIDYIVPGNVANSGYMYFNPDGSIRIMATINSGYYIRGTRLYITNDDYPS